LPSGEKATALTLCPCRSRSVPKRTRAPAGSAVAQAIDGRRRWRRRRGGLLRPGRRRGGRSLGGRPQGPDSDGQRPDDQDHRRGGLHPGEEEVAEQGVGEGRGPARRRPARGADGGRHERRGHRAGLARQGRPDQGRAQRQAAPGQPPAQGVPAARQPRLERPRVPAQAARRLVLREPFEVTEQQRHPLRLREPRQFLVEQAAQLAPGDVLGRVGGVYTRAGDVRRGPPTLAPGQGLARQAVGDAVQPAADRLAASDRRGLARQDQEGGLEGVLGIVGVAEDAAADAEHHRPVAADEGLERRFVARHGEALEQVGVAGVGGAPPPYQRAQVAEDGVGVRGGHGPALGRCFLSPIVAARRWEGHRIFPDRDAFWGGQLYGAATLWPGE
jgi:hypothetical protein